MIPTRPCKRFVLLPTLLLAMACTRNEPSAPENIQVPEGFEVEIAAGPDLVDYPMFALADETGRLFVFESTGNVYDETEDALKDPQFQIKLLEDTNNDGRYDKRTIYADKIGFPQGGVFYKGSLYASSAPDLLKLTDTDGDGKADKREVLLSGWTLNVNANSLIGPFMGPDGWLYLTSAIEGFDVTTKEGVRMKGETSRVWRVRTDGTDLQWMSAGGMNNPVELTFTSASEVLGTQTYFTDPKAGQRDALMYWTEGGIYPKPNSNIARDRLPLTGDLLPVVTKYSRVAPAGITRYRHTALGSDFHNNLFSAQFNTHRVLRHKLVRDGASFRTDDEVFFSSTLEDFHPTDVLEDGDGSLLIVETGGWFIKGCPLSQVSKPELKGSIYRVRKKGQARGDDPFGNSIDWKSLDADKLAALLADERPFVVDRAVDNLVEKGEAGVPALTLLLQQSANAAARTRAVFALYRIGSAAAAPALQTGLRDKDLDVRVAAARATGLAKDRGATEQLLEMVRNDEPAAKRQAAAALGQIGDPATIPGLLEAAAKVTDRFVEHAIIYALITMNQPDAVAKGLSHASTNVKKAALIALDQMPTPSLTTTKLTAFLQGQDSVMQRTALWVVSHHPEWAGDMIAYLRTRLVQPLGDREKRQLHEILVSYCSDVKMQQFIAGQLNTAPAAQRLFLLDVMASCNVKEFPAPWTAQLAKGLASAAPAEAKLKMIKLARMHGVRSLGTPLQQVAADAQHPAMLRMAAIGAMLDADSVVTQSQFDYLYAQLKSAADAPTRQQAAAVMEQGALSPAQLLKIAKEFLPSADAFMLPRIVPAFEGAHDPAIGKALAGALMKSPSLDNFTEEYLIGLFSGYPSTLEATRGQLMARLKEVRAERLTRIHAIEGSISKGDIDRGRVLFFGKAICYTCHAIGNEGGTFGPDLTSIQRDRSVHDLVEAIVYPSVSFVREFETYRITTREKAYTGIMREQNDETILLATSPQETVRIPRHEVQSTEPHETSMMPQGLDKLLTEQEMADLMAFLIGQDQDPETDAELLR